MADKEQLVLLRTSVDSWNSWRKDNQEVRPDLSHANLAGANLQGADLRGAELQKADLSDANLQGANLIRATLVGTFLYHANLQGANLFDAKLRHVIFSHADLTGANLEGAHLFENMFGKTNLTEAKGLDHCRHLGPSVIDFRTLERSGPLPLAFLRGCGLPDNLIDYLPSLLNQAIQLYSCFISYATKDSDFANRLYADLQDKGVRCWFAPEDLKIGDELRSTFDEAIKVRDKLLIVLSETSIARPWVKREVEQALDEEQRRDEPVLFPVRLDNAVFEVTAGWATDVKRRHIGDFRAWKDHDDYQRALERLLRDLKVQTP